MSKTLRDLILITTFVIASTFLIWLPHILSLNSFLGLNFSEGFNTIYRNYDGMEYVVIAKTGYSPESLKLLPQQLESIYYAAHFPGYSIFIYLFAPILGFLKSMLFVSLLFTTGSAITFYFLVKDFRLTTQPLILSLVFLVVPARWVVIRSVGSAEPMFIFFSILTFYFLMKGFGQTVKHKFIWLSAIFATIALLTRPPGVLIALSALVYLMGSIYKNKDFSMDKVKRYLSFYPFLLVPLTLLGIFYYYGIVFNDFWAYFHSGDNIHLTFPPFQSLNPNQFWVGKTIWLEDIIYIFLLGFLAAFMLIKQKLNLFGIFVLTYLTASIFVAHRDISRYTIPTIPFVLIAFEKVLVSKEFRLALIILLIGIYMYSQNFILQNTAPIPNVGAYD